MSRLVRGANVGRRVSGDGSTGVDIDNLDNHAGPDVRVVDYPSMEWGTVL